MSNYFLTTFNKKLYDEYAKELINTYLDTNQHIPLYCYVEEDDFSIYPQHSKIVYLNIFKESPILDFIKKYDEGEVFDPLSSDRYVKDAVRFAYKVYAQCAGKNLGDRQFFIDADCIFLKQIPMDWYDSFIDDKDFSYYPRPSYYTETGFVTYNCKSEVVHKFFDKFQEIYDSGKIFDYEQQNDSYIFDRVMEMFPEATAKFHGGGDSINDHEFHRHVMARCPILSPYIDHRKGGRKNMKRSPELLK
jgi:hypothetical protein